MCCFGCDADEPRTVVHHQGIDPGFTTGVVSHAIVTQPSFGGSTFMESFPIDRNYSGYCDAGLSSTVMSEPCYGQSTIGSTMESNYEMGNT